MAVIKTNYVKRNSHERANAKRTVRYIAHRKGKDQERMSRMLFGRDGIMGRDEAYRLIDQAEAGSVFYRIILSPDPKAEDTKRDLPLREVTEKTMLSLETHVQTSLAWVATVHDDHVPHRHVHIVAAIPKLKRQDFQALPQVLRSTATAACLQARLEQDLGIEKQVLEREEAQWERGY